MCHRRCEPDGRARYGLWRMPRCFVHGKPRQWHVIEERPRFHAGHREGRDPCNCRGARCAEPKTAGLKAMQKHVLGIDVGTGGTRALIMDDQGHILASATEEHEAFASPKIGWAEQKPEDWWRACGTAVRKALTQRKLRGDQTACVGFSGQMHGAVMLD